MSIFIHHDPEREFAEDRKRNAEQDALLEELFGMPGAELGGKVGKAMERKIRVEMMTRDAMLRELKRKVDALQEMCDRMWLAFKEMTPPPTLQTPPLSGETGSCGEGVVGIEARRKAVGMSQQELADKIGVSRSAVAMWESGASAPRAGMLPALADALWCSVDELLRDCATA